MQLSKEIQQKDFVSTKQNSFFCLRDSIDVPIRKCVALLNLLGLKTVWSCCGFNYEEKNIKDHVQGIPQIFIEANEKSFKLLLEIIDYNLFKCQGAWNVMIRCLQFQEPTFILYCHFDQKQNWGNQDSPHFHERIVINIKYLEERLLQFKDLMVDEVILSDTNKMMKNIIEYWNMKYSNDWVIKKIDYVK